MKALKAKECQHWGAYISDFAGEYNRVIRRCAYCRDYLSLGHSDETPVAHEIRAAELALIDGWYNERRFESESYGALCFMNGGTPGDDDDGGNSDNAADEWAGFLAQAIRTHDGGKP